MNQNGFAGGAKLSRAAVLAVALAAQPGTAYSEDRPPQTQAVMLHDLAGVPPHVIDGANAVVSRIFHWAGVRVVWLACSPDGAEPGQATPCPSRTRGTIGLRVVPGELGVLGASALGYAAVSGQEGVLATVSLSRVRRCSAAHAQSEAVLAQVLGHAMAHEIDHILLGEGSHSEKGLMRANWNRRMLASISTGTVGFSREQARRIQDAVLLRTATAANLSQVGTPRQ